MSVGLFNYAETFIGTGEQATVNSQTVHGPATALRRGVVREVSIVTLGADPNATSRLFDTGVQRGQPSLSACDILARRRAQAAGLR